MAGAGEVETWGSQSTDKRMDLNIVAALTIDGCPYVDSRKLHSIYSKLP